MSLVHTSRLRIEQHEGPHRTAHIEGFADPIHFGIRHTPSPTACVQFGDINDAAAVRIL